MLGGLFGTHLGVWLKFSRCSLSSASVYAYVACTRTTTWLVPVAAKSVAFYFAAISFLFCNLDSHWAMDIFFIKMDWILTMDLTQNG